MSKTIYRATYESSHFEFEAYGLTSSEALKALKAGLEKHTEQYDLERGWYSKDDLNIYTFELGVPYRDTDVISDDNEDPNDYAGMGWIGKDGQP